LKFSLKIFHGETPLALQEIYEVGEDVAERIRHLQASVAGKTKKKRSLEQARKPSKKK